MDPFYEKRTDSKKTKTDPFFDVRVKQALNLKLVKKFLKIRQAITTQGTKISHISFSQHFKTLNWILSSCFCL
jgi:hypothetical protein